MDDLKTDTLVELHENDPEMISISVICRLCANQNDKLIGIFSDDGLNNDLANKMNMYLPVKVTETDVLPLQCCWQCASTVLAWHDLVITSVEADRRLRNCQFISSKLEEHVVEQNVEVITTDNSLEHEQRESFDEEKSKSSIPNLNAFCQSGGLQVKEEKLKTKSKQGKENSQLLQNDGINLLETKLISQVSAEFKSENELDFIPEANDDYKETEFNENDSEEPELFKYGCQYCTSMFLNEDEIMKHIQDEHNEDEANEHEEMIDSQRNTSKKERRKHNKLDQDLVNAAKVIVDGRIYYNCKECGKSLHSPYTYVWHMRIHTGERPFVCDLCGKQFRVSQGLVRHLKETHERIKNFACDLCGRMFATKRNVEEHRRIHTNERPYICDLCGKTFKQKASLFVHNRSHTDLFPFKCTYCTQVFRTKPPLLIHITRHTGEKPYPCDICGRCFRIKYELKRHRLIHSDEKPFSCQECGLSFRQKRYLRNHNKLNHQ